MDRAQPSTIDPQAPIPLHVQVKATLLDEIKAGRYGADGRLPTEDELCRRYAISRTPVHRALSELAADGVIVRHRRRGSFVDPVWWANARTGTVELTVVVPGGAWAGMLESAAPAGVRLAVHRVELPDLHRALVEAVGAGHAPDLAVLDSVWVPEFARAGFLHPLDDVDPEWVAGELDRDFVQPFASVHRRDGAPVAIQAEVDVAGLWYRRSALAGIGAPVPSTWDDLITVGRKLASVRGAHPLAMPGGPTAGEAATYCLAALLASNDAAVLDDRGVTIAEPHAVACLEFLRELVDEGVVPATAAGYAWDRSIELLGTGAVDISFGGSYEGPALAAAAGLDVDAVWDEFGFAMLPTGPNGRPVALAGGMVYAMFRQTRYPELAMRLLENLVSTPAVAQMSRRTAQLPPRRSAAAEVAGHSPFLRATTAMLDGAAVRPVTPHYATVSAQARILLGAVVSGAAEPEPACHLAADRIGAITGLPVA